MQGIPAINYSRKTVTNWAIANKPDHVVTLAILVTGSKAPGLQPKDVSAHASPLVCVSLGMCLCTEFSFQRYPTVPLK